MISVFVSYSHRDELFREQLDTHLKLLQRQGVISMWHDKQLAAGDNIDRSIDSKISDADVVLLLVSADFLASDYCYGREMSMALDRNSSGKCRVIPVILRPCDWTETPIGKLLALPTNGKPISLWTSPDEAFLIVTRELRSISKSHPVRRDVSAADAVIERSRPTKAEHTRPATTEPAGPNNNSEFDIKHAQAVTRVQEVISQMRSAIGSDSGLGGTLKFDFGEVGSILIDGKSSPNTVTEGSGKSAECTVKVSLDTFDQMVRGELDGTSAFMQGKLRVSGDMGIAMKLGPILQRTAAT